MNDDIKKPPDPFPGNPAYIISDEPTVAEKQLETGQSFQFDSYANSLAKLIANKKNKTPLVLGIYGPWGSGKTTLMKKIQERLNEFPGSKKEQYRVCKTVWFQPWKLDREDAILAGLIEEILKSMSQGTIRDKVYGKLEELSKKFSENSTLSKMLTKLTADTLDVSSLFGSLSHEEKLGFYHIFEKYFSDLIWTYTRDMTKPGDDDSFDDEKGVVVVFIDDLDRCKEGRVLKVLETIKLFVNQPGCVVVLGVARDVLNSALKNEGLDKENYAEQFMQKIVQVTFELPTKTAHGMGDYLGKLAPDQPLLQEYSTIISRALEFNPRGIKRFLNDLSLNRSLISDLGLETEESELEKALVIWTILGVVFSKFVKYVRRDHSAIKEIKETVKKIGERTNWRLEKDELVGLKVELHIFIENRDFVNLIKKFPDNEEALKQVVEFSSMVEQAEPESPEKQEGLLTHDAMVTVSKGKFLYLDVKETRAIEKDYKIDMYPVTNERYRNFISDDGYKKKDLWSEDGRKWREKNNIVQPEYWDDPKWNQPDCPVVGVSWYEAEAFAKWEGKRLPTEEEWERAARGDKGRKYPWGDEFDKEKCNSGVSGINKTTPVNSYLEGKSPAGCFDMSGNVWEWTVDWYDEDKDFKVLRGGSWNNNPVVLRAATRYRLNPTLRYFFIGFRCSQ